MRIVKVEKNGCMPCKKMDEILKKLNVEVEHINIDEISAEELQNIKDEYGIMSTPVLLKIENENRFSMLNGINHTMDEFREFLGLNEQSEITQQINPNYVNCCSNGYCSL